MSGMKESYSEGVWPTVLGTLLRTTPTVPNRLDKASAPCQVLSFVAAVGIGETNQAQRAAAQRALATKVLTTWQDCPSRNGNSGPGLSFAIRNYSNRGRRLEHATRRSQR